MQFPWNVLESPSFLRLLKWFLLPPETQLSSNKDPNPHVPTERGLYIYEPYSRKVLNIFLSTFLNSLEHKWHDYPSVRKLWTCPLLTFAKYLGLSLVQDSSTRTEAFSKLTSWTVSVNEQAQVAMQAVICFHKRCMNDSAWQTHCMDFKVPGNSVLPSVPKIHFQPQPHSQRAWVEKMHCQMFVSGYMGPVSTL